MNEEYRELINAWLKLAAKEYPDVSGRIDVYFRFMALWVAFNAFLNRKYGNVGGDRAKVMSFGEEPQNTAKHEEYLRDNDYSGAVAVLRERGVRDMKAGTDRTYNISDNNLFPEVMKCVYQVRCNLFHGEKGVDDGRDNQLVEAAHRIVEVHLNGLMEREA